MSSTFVTPELGKGFKLAIEDEDAKELFIEFATRNGKWVKELLSRRIWSHHDLPMYRGTIVDEVPFTLKIDQLLFNFKSYSITVQYRFLGLE